MVSELHKRGYQRLRAIPAMSASGAHWRCTVTPASNTLRTHGARFADWGVDDSELVALYSSGQENEYFGWTDRKESTARQLADTFLERFPRICAASKGADWAYAGWFIEMLGLAECGWFPIVYADYDLDESHGLVLTHPGREPEGRKPTLPLPPPGEAEDPGWPNEDESE